MAIPHVEVDDLSAVSWTALWEAGFRGCIFDKDNTITEPYQLTLEPSAAKGLEECRKAFHGNIVLYSNSAGLQQFDPNGEEAMKLEAALGIPVLRHRQKKPAGDAEDIEKHFGCDASKIIMIGDRYLTDVAFGNRLGMLTIRQKPFTSSGEPVAVRAARLVEESFVAQCLHRGVVAPKHPLLRTLDKGVLMNCSAIENGGRRGVC